MQRVPVTEGSGRIHTSAVTVAVLAEADEVEIAIDPKEIRIDVFAPRARVVRASIRRTRRCASRIFRPASSFHARMRSRSIRTAPRA